MKEAARLKIQFPQPFSQNHLTKIDYICGMNEKQIPIELLAPAKNSGFGKAAISHGADAVYIGAPRFGARVAASNTVNEIEELVSYAHLYKARVYTALNTILYDEELEEAEKLIHELYHVGVDGLIIQDMGILEMNLPPVTLIASTQTHNATPEKVRFLEDIGFKRVILARELSLKQIEEIRNQTTLELESFVHGALCVSYSGQCYMSQSVCGRSGNRGECAQPCRSAYDLIDSKGNILFRNKHLLSLKDLNLSASVESLLQAGITSFKIEGRLKDITYVKNVTASYRQEIDRILEGKDQYVKSSSGKVSVSFTPDTERSFNRGFTSYYLYGRKEKMSSFLTQKSLGKMTGKITRTGSDWIEVDYEGFSNGDGICFFDPHQNLSGTLINRVEGSRLYPASMEGLKKGLQLYRNHDQAFEKVLIKESGERKIKVSLHLEEHENGFVLTAVDEDQTSFSKTIDLQKNTAEKQELVRTQIIAQLSKMGNTPFFPGEIELSLSTVYFIPAAVLNQLRRDVLSRLAETRIKNYQPHETFFKVSEIPFPEKQLTYQANVSNQLAAKFYKRHGAESIQAAYEKTKPTGEHVVMTTKHCIRFQLDACPFYQKPAVKMDEPLCLTDGRNTFRLEFDCKRCVMKVIRIEQ